jgi:uncharacterized protein YutE (UPF0331/DUF86 family)
MKKKARKNIKRELAEKERERLLKEVENIDAVLDGKMSEEESLALLNRINQIFSFDDSVSWLQPFIEDNLSDIQARLKSLVDAFDSEFTTSFSVDNLAEEEQVKYFRRAKAKFLVNLFIDGSVLLYALGRNGAVLIELHSIVERQAIEALSEQILLPEKIEIGLKLIERLTLPDISLMLRDCGLIDNDDVKFAQRLNKIRNGLAHRNTKVISNAVYSGRKVSDVSIDFVMEEVDFIPFAVGAVKLLVKLIDWDELNEEAEQAL